MPADLHGRAGIAPLAAHLVEPRGAQAGILRQGVADERQERVKGARAAHAPAAAARLVLPRGAHRLMVDAEGGGEGPDLPVLAEREAPDLRPVAASSGSAAPSSNSPPLNQATASKPTRSPAALTWKSAPASSIHCSGVRRAWCSLRVNM